MIQDIKKKLKRAFPRTYTVTRDAYHLAFDLFHTVLSRQKARKYPSLYRLYSPFFTFGVAVDSWKTRFPFPMEIGNPEKEQLILHCFNSITCENSFKHLYCFDPAADCLFRISPAAKHVLTFAKKNHIKLRLHVLVWHRQSNLSVFCRDYQCVYLDDDPKQLDPACLVSREELIQRLKTYIYGAAEYIYANGYADCISGWDVVNEAVSNHRNEFLRTNSLWMQIIGPEYIYYSFLYMREAGTRYAEQYKDLYGGLHINPRLFYNDYNEWFPKKQEKIIRLLRDTVLNPDHLIQSDAVNPDGNGTLLDDGLVDGIGMQGHLDTNVDVSQFMSAMKAYNELTGLVHVTELDVANRNYPDTEKTALLYNELFQAFVDAVKNGIGLESVTVWGLMDDRAYKREKHITLLFDEKLNPKKEFYAVVEAVKDDHG